MTWGGFRDQLYKKSWVVYAKPPFGSPEQVLRYLGRYTHKVAISNHRIVDFKNGKVTFTIKDYKNDGKRKRLSLEAIEFLRRFLMHVLPKGFVRIRHYGLYAGPKAKAKIATARRLLDPLKPERDEVEPTEASSEAEQHPSLAGMVR